MTLPGVTPFPPEFAARYRARGYWEDRPLISHFLPLFADYAGGSAVVDDEGSCTYAELVAAAPAGGAHQAPAGAAQFSTMEDR